MGFGGFVWVCVMVVIHLSDLFEERSSAPRLDEYTT